MAVVSKGKVENVLKKDKWSNPKILLQDHVVVDSGCSSHMTGNKAYLLDCEDLNGGFVAFGSDPKGGWIEAVLANTTHLWSVNFGSLQVNSGRILVNSVDLRIRFSILTISVHQHVHMANLKYLDKHNMVAFWKKPNESVGFTEFWQTATVRTRTNGTQQLVASIDSKEYNITEASVRSKLQLADATGIHNLSDAKIYVGLATFCGVDPIPSTSQPLIPSPPHLSPPHQSPPHSPPHPTPHSPPYSPPHPTPHSPPHSPPHPTPHSPPHSTSYSTPHYSPTRSYEAPLLEGNTSGSTEDSVQLKELMVLVPKLVYRIGSLEKELKETKQTLGNVVLTLVKKVKTLEVALKRKSKKVIVSESEGEEPEDQGRIIQDIDDDPLVSLVLLQKIQGGSRRRYQSYNLGGS
ncbi:hypothetical protein Tco_1426693 [Tanacetum coccineum]